MAGIDDIADRLSVTSGKTGNENLKAIKSAIRSVISTINREMNNYTVADRDKTISVSANAQEVTLPKECRRIIELGLYDSTTDRIEVVYDEISEQEFHASHSGQQTFVAVDPTSRNQYVLLDLTAGNQLQIRLVYPPSSAFTMMARYYTALTDDNLHLLDADDIVYDGARAQLAEWFPASAGIALRNFKDGIRSLRASRRSIKRTVRKQVRPDIGRHNLIMSHLTR